MMVGPHVQKMYNVMNHQKKIKVVTLCGSNRFKEEFFEHAQRLTMDGNIVLSPFVFSHADGIEIDEDFKNTLDDMHKSMMICRMRYL